MSTDAARVQRRTVADPEAMHELGQELGGRLAAGDLVVLTGPLGAGKTTLTRGIGEALGVRGPVTSPTFVIARTHPSLLLGPALVHVDAYRLGGADELDDLDIDFDNSVVIIEWGSGFAQTGASWVELVIERPTGAGLGGEETDYSEEPVEARSVTIYGHGPRWNRGVL